MLPINSRRMSKIYFDENVLIFLLGNNKIRLYHAILRQNTLICKEVLDILSFIGSEGQEEKKSKRGSQIAKRVTPSVKPRNFLYGSVCILTRIII